MSFSLLTFPWDGVIMRFVAQLNEVVTRPAFGKPVAGIHTLVRLARFTRCVAVTHKDCTIFIGNRTFWKVNIKNNYIYFNIMTLNAMYDVRLKTGIMFKSWHNLLFNWIAGSVVASIIGGIGLNASAGGDMRFCKGLGFIVFLLIWTPAGGVGGSLAPGWLNTVGQGHRSL